MKLKKFIYGLLRFFNYCLGFCGVFGILGTVGALECDQIGFGRFWIQLFIAVCLIGLAFIVYNIRENFKYYYIKERK
jgi:hypothetical protein